MERSEPASMSVIREAAKSFGSPEVNAIQPTVARQVNTIARKPVHPRAAYLAPRMPRSMRIPQNDERAPKVPPEINAVFAPAGLERNPAIPQRTRNSPNPINQRPVNFIVERRFCNASTNSKQFRTVKRAGVIVFERAQRDGYSCRRYCF
jgi:hypothetical protein